MLDCFCIACTGLPVLQTAIGILGFAKKVSMFSPNLGSGHVNKLQSASVGNQASSFASSAATH